MKVKVKAIKNFTDLEEVDETGKNIRRIANKSEWICNKERSDYLLEHKAIEVVEEVKSLFDTTVENESIIPLDEKGLEEVKEQIQKHIKVSKKKKSSKKKGE